MSGDPTINRAVEVIRATVGKALAGKDVDPLRVWEAAAQALAEAGLLRSDSDGCQLDHMLGCGLRPNSETDAAAAPEDARRQLHSGVVGTTSAAVAFMSDRDRAIVELAELWYDTGSGKEDVAHELALAIMRKRLALGAGADRGDT